MPPCETRGISLVLDKIHNGSREKIFFSNIDIYISKWNLMLIKNDNGINVCKLTEIKLFNFFGKVSA